MSFLSKPWRIISQFLYITSILLLFSGISEAYHGFSTLQKVAATKQGPSTTGKVISTQIETISPNKYALHVLYEYLVDGGVYVTSELLYEGSSDLNKIKQSQQSLYKTGSTTTIHYNPNDPNWCSTANSALKSSYSFLPLSLTFIIVGVLSFCFSLFLDLKYRHANGF